MDVKTNKKIEMVFSSNMDTTAKVSVPDPVELENGELVVHAMETIVGKKVLMDNKGCLMTAAKGAKLIEITERTLF